MGKPIAKTKKIIGNKTSPAELTESTKKKSGIKILKQKLFRKKSKKGGGGEINQP